MRYFQLLFPIIFFKHCPELPEGELTKLRASLVCEKTLFEFAKQIELGKYLVLSKGERNNGGAERPSILSDAFEALIAAIYIDGGIDPASKHILNFVIPAIKNSKKKKLNDYKTALQEIIQKNPGEQLEYVLVVKAVLTTTNTLLLKFISTVM